MKAWRILIGLMASAAWASAIAQTPPAGWRLPTQTDLWIDDERMSLAGLKAEADFNGDGRTDQAFVLIRKTDANAAGVFVFLDRAGQAPVIQKLDQYPASAGEFVLNVVEKGCYPILKKTICLGNPGLLRLEIEYGWSTLYWMEKSKWRQIVFARGDSDDL